MPSSTLLASAVSLTTSLTASTNTAAVAGYGSHTVHLNWTPGTAGNILTVAVDFRVQTSASSGSTWAQEHTWDESTVASGTRTNTRTLEQYQFTATGTSAVGLYISVKCNAGDIRIRYAESEDGSSTKGTITAYVLSSPA